MNWNEGLNVLTDTEFTRTYRVDKVLFAEILEKIRQPLEVAEPSMARNSEPVSPELKLSMTEMAGWWKLSRHLSNARRIIYSIQQVSLDND